MVKYLLISREVVWFLKLQNESEVWQFTVTAFGEDTGGALSLPLEVVLCSETLV